MVGHILTFKNIYCTRMVDIHADSSFYTLYSDHLVEKFTLRQWFGTFNRGKCKKQQETK